MLAKAHGKKAVVSFHGWQKPFEWRISRGFSWMFRFFFGRVDAFVVLSDAFKKSLENWGVTKPIYREVTVNGNETSEGLDMRRTLRRRHESDKWRVLFMSRILKTKGIYETVQAARLLQTKYPNIELIVAGNGDDLENVKRFAHEIGASNVVFSGYVSGDEKRKLFEQASVFCLPSYSEGFPVAVVEAMAFGLPVITRPVGGLMDFFKDGKHGFMSDSLDARVLAKEIERLYTDKELCDGISLSNYQYAQSHFLASDAARRLERIYDVLLNTHKRVGPEVCDDGDLLIESIGKLVNWIEEHDYKGFEPFDGLSSYLRPLTFGNYFAERVLRQLVLRCPFHIRPLLGIRPLHSTKGMGFIARGYLRMFSLTGDPEYRDKARYCLDWLIENRSPGYSGHCWGNHFHYAARKGKIPKYVPTIVWTSLIGQSFLDAYELLGDEAYLDVASSICRFILEDLPREQTPTGACLSYFPLKEQHAIHNSNMLGAAMLARTTAIVGDEEARRVAEEAMRYSCSRQLPDGAWHYGEAPTYHWIDNWHTGYNLDGLKCYIESTNDTTFEENLRRGFAFYTRHFFLSDGRPKYYHDSLHLVDIQSASQSIDTLAYFSDHDKTTLPLARSVAKWTIRNMQDKTGYFYYRKLRWKTVKVPMLHWGQATMLSALSHLLLKLSAGESSARNATTQAPSREAVPREHP